MKYLFSILLFTGFTAVAQDHNKQIQKAITDPQREKQSAKADLHILKTQSHEILVKDSLNQSSLKTKKLKGATQRSPIKKKS